MEGDPFIFRSYLPRMFSRYAKSGFELSKDDLPEVLRGSAVDEVQSPAAPSGLLLCWDLSRTCVPPRTSSFPPGSSGHSAAAVLALRMQERAGS